MGSLGHLTSLSHKGDWVGKKMLWTSGGRNYWFSIQLLLVEFKGDSRLKVVMSSICLCSKTVYCLRELHMTSYHTVQVIHTYKHTYAHSSHRTEVHVYFRNHSYTKEK